MYVLAKQAALETGGNTIAIRRPINKPICSNEIPYRSSIEFLPFEKHTPTFGEKKSSLFYPRVGERVIQDSRYYQNVIAKLGDWIWNDLSYDTMS